MDLGHCVVIFCREAPETQDLKVLIFRETKAYTCGTLGTLDPALLTCRGALGHSIGKLTAFWSRFAQALYSP